MNDTFFPFFLLIVGVEEEGEGVGSVVGVEVSKGATSSMSPPPLKSPSSEVFGDGGELSNSEMEGVGSLVASAVIDSPLKGLRGPGTADNLSLLFIASCVSTAGEDRTGELREERFLLL